jgi:hypothetical protein
MNGSSGKVPTLQVQSLDFKPQYYKKRLLEFLMRSFNVTIKLFLFHIHICAYDLWMASEFCFGHLYRFTVHLA